MTSLKNFKHHPLLLVMLFTSALCGADRPNVLLIVTDEHNFRTLGCYRATMPREQAEMWGIGAVVPTPHLDRLAKEGVLCTRAYATSPVCSPCRAAMITGRYPHATGVPANDLVLDRSIPTLADRLNDAGYRSAFIGKWHLGGTGKPEWAPKIDGGFQFKKYMFNRGHWKKFDVVDGVPRVAARKRGEPTYALDGADDSTFSTDWLTNRAIEFITDAAATKPFFTVISYPDPHGPNTVRAPYDQQFDDLPFMPPRTYRTGLAQPKWLGGAEKHPVFRGQDMSRYFGMVKCLDDNIGRLLDRMKEAGRLDNTLIIMTSDHGDLCYEHDRQNKGNPYEGSARVPMILRQPGRIAAAQYYTQPMGSVDLTPTVMCLLKLPGDPADHGRDLSAQLADASKPLSDDEPAPVTFLRNAGVKAGWVAAVDARYKLILSVNDGPWLFDAKEDPDELKNFYGRADTSGVAKRLASALREYGNKTNDPHLRNDKIAASLASVLGAELQIADAEGDPQWAKFAPAAMEKLIRTVTFTIDETTGTHNLHSIGSEVCDARSANNRQRLLTGQMSHFGDRETQMRLPNWINQKCPACIAQCGAAFSSATAVFSAVIPRDAGPIANAVHVRVDCDRIDPKRKLQYDVGTLATDSR